MIASTLAFAARHERTLSAASMAGGFAFDNFAFRRIDLPNTQLVFIAYLSVAALSMLGMQILAERAAEDRDWPRWRALPPMAVQFALGGLWSAFLVFYSRSAVLAASWPYLLVLFAIFLGNEIFKKYHSRLAFAAVLLFFALLSYAIVTVPLFTHAIGPTTFLLSGAAAVGAFVVLAGIAAILGPREWRAAWAPVAAGSALVYALITAFYFTGILPPLPLVLADGGIYHFIEKEGAVYRAQAEPQAAWTRFGPTPVVHVAPGEPLYAYSAVFAPVRLTTNIQHRWRRYDIARKSWRTVSVVSFPIMGGRDGGYRGYSVSHHVTPGDWRVDVDTPDGRVIGRIEFRAEPAPGSLPTVPVVLK